MRVDSTGSGAFKRFQCDPPKYSQAEPWNNQSTNQSIASATSSGLMKPLQSSCALVDSPSDDTSIRKWLPKPALIWSHRGLNWLGVSFLSESVAWSSLTSDLPLIGLIMKLPYTDRLQRGVKARQRWLTFTTPVWFGSLRIWHSSVADVWFFFDHFWRSRTGRRLRSTRFVAILWQLNLGIVLISLRFLRSQDRLLESDPKLMWSPSQHWVNWLMDWFDLGAIIVIQ